MNEKAKNDELRQVLKNADPKAVATALSAVQRMTSEGGAKSARLEEFVRRLTKDDIETLRRVVASPQSAEALLRQSDVAERLRILTKE